MPYPKQPETSKPAATSDKLSRALSNLSEKQVKAAAKRAKEAKEMGEKMNALARERKAQGKTGYFDK